MKRLLSALAVLAVVLTATSAQAQVSCYTYGNTTTCSDGTSAYSYGNTTTFSDGTSCYTYGGTTTCN